MEKAHGTVNANRRNKFHTFNLTESGPEVEEVNAVDVVQKKLRSLSVRELRRASGRSKSVTRSKAMKMVRIAATSGRIREEGDARL